MLFFKESGGTPYKQTSPPNLTSIIDNLPELQKNAFFNYIQLLRINVLNVYGIRTTNIDHLWDKVFTIQGRKNKGLSIGWSSAKRFYCHENSQIL